MRVTTSAANYYRVTVQSPTAGTPAPVGSAVNVIIGKPKPIGGF
ncbi:hypothetical protein [Phytohabitans kaempferiae]|uniref:PASTA domain-containing protein n=1 Tax=Phytohabitans kaempferiae TaxID=1620943 RepID=A0ABV6M9J9_9ACTN